MQTLRTVIRGASADAAALAERGAFIGGFVTAGAGVVLAIALAIWRGLIPDLATAAAVGAMGVVLYVLAGGFLGALVGGVLGGVVGAGRGAVRAWQQTA